MSNTETSKASYIDRMNIVHVLPALTKGGGEKVAVDLANHAARTGHEVTMLVEITTSRLQNRKIYYYFKTN